MITTYLNQSVEWKKYTGTNGYGEPTYSKANTIKARYRRKLVLLRDTEGREMLSSGQVLTTSEVGIGDLIDGAEVKDVQFTPSLEGTIYFRTLMMY